MIAFTSDIDWAPDEVIEDMLHIFEEYKVPCTLFCTHDTPVLQNCNRELFELAIHPNFNPLLFDKCNKTAEEIVKELLDIYPEAQGVRSHSMTQSTQLLSLFKRLGLKYDSNQFFPYQFQLAPYDCWTGLKRIPYNWEDDIHFAYGNVFSGSIFDQLSQQNDYFILDFHPVHVYLNTERQATYDRAKEAYKNPRALKSFKNVTTLGTRDILINSLKHLKELGLEGMKLNDFLKVSQ